MINHKNRLNKIIIFLFLLVIIVLLFITIFTTKKQIPEKKEIVKIGFIADFSNYKLRSENSLEAAKIAIEDVNKISNKKYELVVYDVNVNNKPSIENAFESASNDNVLVMINTILILIETNSPKEMIPTISIEGTRNENFSKRIFYLNIPFAFVNSYHVNQHIKLIKSKYNITSAALIIKPERGFFDTPLNTKYIYIEETPDIFIEKIKHKDIKTSIYLFDLGNISNIIEDIKQKNVDIIILLMDNKNAIDFLKTAKESDLKEKLFLGFLITRADILTEEQNLPKRLIIVPFPTDIAGTGDPPRDAFEEFVRKFTSITRKEVRALELNTYDSVSLIAQAVAKANITNKPESIKENREKVMKELWSTVKLSLRGTITYDTETGYLKRNYVSFFYIDSSEFKPARGIIT